MPTGFMIPEAHTYLNELVPDRHPELQTMEAYARSTSFRLLGRPRATFAI